MRTRIDIVGQQMKEENPEDTESIDSGAKILNDMFNNMPKEEFDRSILLLRNFANLMAKYERDMDTIKRTWPYIQRMVADSIRIQG